MQCRLCESACPFDSIRPAFDGKTGDQSRDRRRLGFLLALLPVFVAAGGFVGWVAAPALAQAHPQVRLARQIAREEVGLTALGTLESDAFRSARTPLSDLLLEAEGIVRTFRIASPLAGAAIALVFGVSLAASLLRKRRSDWAPDRGECFSCGRCFSYCPREHQRLEARRAAPATGEPRA